MSLAKSDLIACIWQNYAGCAARGLTLDPRYQQGRRYQGVDLGEHGIADLVNVRFSVTRNCYFVQVIEVSEKAIDRVAYLRVKRYLTVLATAVGLANQLVGLPTTIAVEAVLIGQTITDEVVYALPYDLVCQVYYYTYGVNGLAFTAAPTPQTADQKLLPPPDEIAHNLVQIRAQALAHWQQREAARQLATHGLSASLVITAGGILNNQGLPLPTEEDDAD